jgi:hypothetical protein
MRTDHVLNAAMNESGVACGLPSRPYGLSQQRAALPPYLRRGVTGDGAWIGSDA